MPTPRKRNKKLCVTCEIAKATVFIKPNGRVLKDGTGYCVSCHERSVRASVDTGRARDYTQVGTHPVVAVF